MLVESIARLLQIGLSEDQDIIYSSNLYLHIRIILILNSFTFVIVLSGLWTGARFV